MKPIATVDDAVAYVERNDPATFTEIAMHEYPQMVGDPDELQPSDPQWPERQGKRVEIVVRHLDQYGVSGLISEVEKVLNADPAPWTIWPAGKPCGTPDVYFQYTAGITLESLIGLVRAFHPGTLKNEHPLIKRLQVAEARHRKTKAVTTLQHPRGKTSTYRLTVLAKDHPAIFKDFEDGKYPSVHAADRAAGSRPVKKTPAEQLEYWWNRASVKERAGFLVQAAQANPKAISTSYSYRRQRTVVRSDGARFASLTEAARAVGVGAQNIWDACNGLKATSGGYGWGYADDVEEVSKTSAEDETA